MGYNFNFYFPDFNIPQQLITDFCKISGNHLDCQNIIPVINGTVALEITLKGLGLKRGDFVIVPDISFIATATAVANCGLIPIYADVNTEYFGLTVEKIHEILTPNVKAVIVVHFSGFVNREIFKIKEYCQEHNLFLIEDCAQVFSCSAEGIKVGTIGDAGTFSFQSSKIINSGEGGLICTNNLELASECEAIADWGLSPKFSQRKLDIASSNYRLSALQCLFLSQQIKVIDEIVAARLDLVERLKVECDKRNLKICFPTQQENFLDCPFFFPIKSKHKLNTIEPREESPMHKSKIVPAIFKRYFPDLLDIYEKANPPEFFKNYNSNNIIADVDFINLYQAKNTPVSDVIAVYKNNNS